MKRTNAVAKLLASSLLDDGRVYDESAETSSEIAAKLGMKQTTAKDRIRKFIAEGKLEKVWKHVNGLSIPAYRVKK